MDPTRFDAIARALAEPGNRRRLIAGIAVGALGLVGLGRADAAACRAPGDVCREHANCCSGLCGERDRTGRQRCQCKTIADCPTPDQCHDATCDKGVCGTKVRQGQACDDRNACTTGETCQATGKCGGGTAVTCTASDQCHVAGTCDPTTGTCSNPNADNGTPCERSPANLCTADTCQNGTCTQGADVVTPTCQQPNQCQSVTCTPATGQCTTIVNKPETAACQHPNKCVAGAHCDGAGTCVGTLLPDDAPCDTRGDVCCGGICTVDDLNCGGCGVACGSGCKCTQTMTSPEGTRFNFCGVVLQRDPCEDDDDCPGSSFCDDDGVCAVVICSGQTCPPGERCNFAQFCVPCCGGVCPDD